MHYYLADDTIEMLENMSRRPMQGEATAFAEVSESPRCNSFSILLLQRSVSLLTQRFSGRNAGCAPYPMFWRRSPLRKTLGLNSQHALARQVLLSDDGLRICGAGTHARATVKD